MLVRTIAPPKSHSLSTGVVALLAVALAIAAFGNALWVLVNRWYYWEEYSHGFLIPVVSAWLLWSRREELRASVGQPSWMSLVLIGPAIVLHVVGEYSSIFVFSQIGFILVLFGIVLAIGGYQLLKATFIPIGFLIFAIPLPYFLEAKLTLQLQLISSQLGVDVIRLFQIPVYLEGNVIDLGYYKLQVVEACSGLRYLYPLLSLSFLAAYLFQAPFWQRALIFLSGVPITIGMNGFRIGMVGVTVDLWGTKMADSVLHFFEGWIIFIACAAILIAEIYVMARLSGRTFLQVFYLPVSTTKRSNEKAVAPTSRAALVSCVVLIAAGGAGIQLISHRAEIIPERTPFADFPQGIGAWHGHTGMLDNATEQGLGLTDYILADYSKPGGQPVNLYVAYYNSQRNGYAPHSPSVCIPGDGWLITQFDSISYDGLGTKLPLNRAIIQKGRTRELVYYWFDERGRQIANEYWAKWYLLTDAIIRNRTDGALVRLVTEILPGETVQDADRRLQSFMGDVVPDLGAYLPGAQNQPKSALSRSNNGPG
jgi:exosortase D (VPLPA-CTERM-specific)